MCFLYNNAWIILSLKRVHIILDMATPKFRRETSIQPNECALLVVDMQKFCAAPGMGMHADTKPDLQVSILTSTIKPS